MLLMTGFALHSHSQKIIVSGFVKDSTAKEALIGASIILVNSETGTDDHV